MLKLNQFFWYARLNSKIFHYKNLKTSTITKFGFNKIEKESVKDYKIDTNMYENLKIRYIRKTIMFDSAE